MRLAIAAVMLLLGGLGRADEALTSARAVALALERNAEIASRAAEVGGAKARLEGARAVFRNNPEVEVAAGPRSARGERTTDVELALTQDVEIFGQRSARIDVARAEVAAAEAALSLKRSEVAAVAATAFARAFAAEQLLEVADEDLSLARESVGAAEKRFELGSGTRLDLNAARVEVGRAARERALAKQALEAARSELRLLVGIPAGVALPLAGAPPSGGDPATLLPSDLLDRALTSRSDVSVARHELAAATAEERVAGREWLPAPKVGARYAREEGADILLASIAFDIPVWNRGVGARGSAGARVGRARAELEATERRVREEVLVAATRIDAARETLRSYDADVVGATAETLTLAGKAYESGKLGLLELLLVRRSALDTRRGEIEAREGVAEAEAELERAIGSLATDRGAR